MSASRSMGITVRDAAPPPPPPGNDDPVAVDFVQVSVVPLGRTAIGRASVRLLDGDGRPLAFARVHGHWTLNGELYYTPTARFTNGNGIVQHAWRFNVESGDRIGFVVTGVTSSLYTGPITPVSGSGDIP